MDFGALEQSVWERLAAEERPIVLYGMGNGADKILEQFELRGIRAAGVFASDEFVRGHTFRGFRVMKFAEVLETFGGNIMIVIAFASHRPEVLKRMYALDATFPVVAPDVPVVPDVLFDHAFVRSHQSWMERAYELMADEQSRAVFLDTVRFKLSGKLCYLRASETDKSEAWDILQAGAAEHFADLGAYTGDTIRELLEHTGGTFASVTALEPDKRNFCKLSAYAQECLRGDVTLEQAGAWDCDTRIPFAAQAGRQSRVAREGVPVQMRSLDSVLAGAPCTLLKMDVEGAERQAICGARQTIGRYRPRLNIAAYHRSGDFFFLPLLIYSICPDYRLYLRRHPCVPAWDTNLYAVADG